MLGTEEFSKLIDYWSGENSLMLIIHDQKVEKTRECGLPYANERERIEHYTRMWPHNTIYL